MSKSTPLALYQSLPQITTILVTVQLDPTHVQLLSVILRFSWQIYQTSFIQNSVKPSSNDTLLNLTGKETLHKC